MQYALVGAGITAFCLLVMTLTDPISFGRNLHGFLFWVGLYIAVVQTAVLSAGLISRERHNQTLGLLFLAGLRPFEVFVSKVLSGALLSFTNLLALAPFMAVPFLSGGLSWQLFVATLFCLPNLLFFALAMTILGSVLCEEEGLALIVATILGGVIAGLTPGLYQADRVFSASRSISPDWLLASPGYGVHLILRNFTAGTPLDFWLNSAVTLCWSCLVLTIAGAILKRTWQDAPVTLPLADWQTGWRAWFKGTGKWRRKTSRRWLDTQPFTWLAMQDRSLERLAWLLVAGIAVIWLAAWLVWSKHWLSLLNLLVTAALMNGVVEGIALYAVGRRIGEDRRSGALELLLTTSLTRKRLSRTNWRLCASSFNRSFG
jgi:ABC-type transport system involved in multi-copper enzyme maturation permease subunit